MNHLSVQDLHIRYPVAGGGLLPGSKRFVEVVRGVSFELDRGKTIAIVGESGSGKTTLAMGLCGLTPIQSGSVTLSGASVKPNKHGALQPDRKRVALMFQDPAGSLSPRMRIGRALEEPFLIHGEAVRPASELLEMVGLTAEFADRYPHQLSGGQARRVGVARALALNPELVIADEPTAGLDVSIQGGVLNLLSDLRDELGLSLMIITHNLNIVRHVADQVAIMYLGQFVEKGESDTILDRPAHPYTAALLSANPKPDPDELTEQVELSGDIPSPMDRPSGCEFHPRCPKAEALCAQDSPGLTRQENQQLLCHFPISYD